MPHFRLICERDFRAETLVPLPLSSSSYFNVQRLTFDVRITLEEELRGVLARTNRTLDPDERILAYQKLIERVNFFARWVVLSLDAESTAAFSCFRSEGIRIATMDLRIACIALAHDATLLTRNTVDFAQVPGLRFENWLE
jgi:tRNA(fMet)-specific endonuclease VapC